MVEVTEADRIAAAAYMKLVGSKRWSQEGILSGGCDNTSIVQAFATHRQQAAKAERDRLRNLPDELVARVIAGVDKLPTIAARLGIIEGLEMAAKAIQDDANLCDCSAWEESECACGAWCEWKTIPSHRAVEIIRALIEEQKV